MCRPLLICLLAACCWNAEPGGAVWFATNGDAEYARRASLSSLYMARLCDLVLERDADPGIAELARDLLAYSRRTSQELSRIAEGKGFHLPIEPDAEQRRRLDEFAEEHKRGIATSFLRLAAEGLRESVALNLRQSESGQDTEFRSFAAVAAEGWEECAARSETLAANLAANP